MHFFNKTSESSIEIGSMKKNFFLVILCTTCCGWIEQKLLNVYKYSKQTSVLDGTY